MRDSNITSVYNFILFLGFSAYINHTFTHFRLKYAPNRWICKSQNMIHVNISWNYIPFIQKTWNWYWSLLYLLIDCHIFFSKFFIRDCDLLNCKWIEIDHYWLSNWNRLYNADNKLYSKLKNNIPNISLLGCLL
jgi:hypothetical protein